MGCTVCGRSIQQPRAAGRPRVTCGHRCRQVAYYLRGVDRETLRRVRPDLTNDL